MNDIAPWDRWLSVLSVTNERGTVLQTVSWTKCFQLSRYFYKRMSVIVRPKAEVSEVLYIMEQWE